MEVKGAQRWLPDFGQTLQVSEIAKPALLVTCAWLFIEGQRTGQLTLQALPFFLFALVAALVFIQPDFSQTMLIAVSFGMTFYLAGFGWRWMAGFGTAIVVMAGVAFAAFPHVSGRLASFLNPDSPAFQTQKALSAIRSGGLFGKGAGEGSVKHSLPDAETDFAFAVAGEEYGGVFLVALIACIVIIAVATFRRAQRLADPVSQLAACSLALLIGFQAFINIGVNLNMLPPTGVTLPLVSNGGSSILGMGYTFGLILAFTRRRPGGFSDMASRQYG